MVNFYKTINEAFDKRYDSNTKKPLTEASAAHAHPDMSKKAGSISSMILSNKDRIDNATSLQDLRAVVEDILSPLEGNAKVTEINGRLRAMKDHVKALQYIYNIILKGDNLGTIKTGKAKERSKNESMNESFAKIITMNADEFFKNSGYTEDDISLHPEKNVVRVYLLDLGEGEDGPYTGVEYDDGTFSVVGLGYDADVNSKEKMKQIVLSGMDEIMHESFRRRRVNESKRKLKEAKNDGIFSMTLSEYADSQGVDEKEAESWVTLHPEKTISKLYFSEDEESPYTGVVYTDGTISVVGLRYDDDVKDFSTMRKVLLSGSEDIFESKRKLNKKKDSLTDNNIKCNQKVHESFDDELSRYQKWIDFDIANSHKVLNSTQQLLKKAGFGLVKDQKGNYQVVSSDK